MNAGYNEIVTMDDKEVLCGITYPLDEARLATASRNPLITRESEKYPTMMDFVYSHMASRLTHPVADLEHAFSGELRWENEVGIANGKTRALDILSTDRCEFHAARRTELCRRLSLVRSIGYATERLNNHDSVDTAMKLLTNQLIELEYKLIQLEFGNNENEEAQIRELQLHRTRLLKKKTEKLHSD
jgi:hypothetical protein